jgi:hypothetical protein
MAGEVADRGAARQEAERLYLEASRQMLDFLMRHHTPLEMLPAGVRTPQELLGRPIWVKWEVLEQLRERRDAQPAIFDHTRTLNEFDGYFDRIQARLARLRAAA